MGRQILFFSILWVANYQTLRTTDLDDWEADKNFTYTTH